MSAGKIGKSRAGDAAPRGGSGGWPAWARGVVSAGLVFHLTAVLAGALGAAPASGLEQAAARLFEGYHEAIDQGYAYRYYAPEPGPTPVVTATVRYDDGRPEESVRLPARDTSPRLRYQRQLALANHLTGDFEEARRVTGDGARSAWARSYARHLARSRPGCSTVTLYTRAHLIPDPRQVVEALRDGRAVDLDAEEFYTAPERIGEFPCDGL
jgi:hypothetical protein